MCYFYFMKKTHIKEALKYLVLFLIFLALANLERLMDIRAFSIAFFMAAVYLKFNVLFLSPLYIAALIIASPTVATLVLAVAPVAVVGAAYFIHYRFKIKIKLWFFSVYMFLAQIPLIVMGAASVYQTVNAVISLVGAQILLFCFVSVLYAATVKRFKLKLAADEILSLGMAAAVLGMALSAMQIGWFNPFFLVLPPALLTLLYIEKRYAVLVAAAFGIGSALLATDASLLALSVIYGVIVGCFNKETQHFAGVAMLAADVIFRGFFGTIDANTALFLIAPAIGLIIFYVIPNKFKLKLLAYATCLKEPKATRSLVNRDRTIVAEKINTLADAFFEMQNLLYVENREREEGGKVQLLTNEVKNRCCFNCASLENCREALGGADTGIIISDLVVAAIDNGKATILDTSPFLSNKCRKINSLISTTNDAANRLRQNAQERDVFYESKKMISEQLGGVGELLRELKNDIEKSLSFDTNLEAKIVDGLNGNGIGATEAVIYENDKKELMLTVVLRESDYLKPKFLETINTFFGGMQISSTENLAKGMVTVHLQKASPFKVVYGDRAASKDDNNVSGDKHKAVKISPDKVMLILSDGMGSGENASLNSGYALSLIESFYKAGFSHKSMLSGVARLLSLREREEFNAIDIAVIDLHTAVADFIKMGGRESFIITDGAVQTVEGGSLPLGILDNEPEPLIERRKLLSGSFIVMLTDGIIDTMGRETVEELLLETKTNNPDTLAGLIMNEYKKLASDKGLPSDDASVLVAKVFKVSS
jgi:stage II sporulation protein E